jgi:hypothetical protein
MIDPSGVYQLAVFPMEVVPDGESWKLILPGAPGGFEPCLIRLSDTTFRIVRGPFHGGIVEFDGPDSGHAGPIPLTRLETPYEEPPGYGLEPPPYEPDPERDQVFAALLDQTEPGGRIEWDLPYPKHEFVRWAQGLDRFIFHSSTNRSIDEFVPIRNSIEFLNHGGRGNLGAVYGTHDGYWSMFFAIVDRSRLRGSIRNGVMRWEAPDGRIAFTYQFSVEQGSLSKRPFTSGAVYLLPRDTFRRLPYYPEGPISDEWASEEPVRPVASLLVEPEDFPFLDRIAGHDEREILEMFDRLRDVLSKATSYRDSDEMAIEVTWDTDTEADFERWSELAGHYIPDVQCRMEGEGLTRTLHLTGPGPFLYGVREQIDGSLAG